MQNQNRHLHCLFDVPFRLQITQRRPNGRRYRQSWRLSINDNLVHWLMPNPYLISLRSPEATEWCVLSIFELFTLKRYIYIRFYLSYMRLFTCTVWWNLFHEDMVSSRAAAVLFTTVDVDNFLLNFSWVFNSSKAVSDEDIASCICWLLLRAISIAWKISLVETAISPIFCKPQISLHTKKY